MKKDRWMNVVVSKAVEAVSQEVQSKARKIKKVKSKSRIQIT